LLAEKQVLCGELRFRLQSFGHTRGKRLRSHLFRSIELSDSTGCACVAARGMFFPFTDSANAQSLSEEAPGRLDAPS
jgi:hypothetical protein